MVERLEPDKPLDASAGLSAVENVEGSKSSGHHFAEAHTRFERELSRAKSPAELPEGYRQQLRANEAYRTELREKPYGADSETCHPISLDDLVFTEAKGYLGAKNIGQEGDTTPRPATEALGPECASRVAQELADRFGYRETPDPADLRVFQEWGRAANGELRMRRLTCGLDGDRFEKERLELTHKPQGGSEALVDALKEHGLAGKAAFEGMDTQTAGKVERALREHWPKVVTKSAPELQGRIIHWADTGSVGNAREFANRVEYAKAVHGVLVDKAGRDHELAKAESEQWATATMNSEAGMRNLADRLKADLKAIADAEKFTIRTSATPEEMVAEIRKKIETEEIIPFESPTAKAYHATRHRGHFFWRSRMKSI